jgi:hypothetical protein
MVTQTAMALSPMSLGATIIWVLIGIVISLVLPVAVKTLKKAGLEDLEPNPTLSQRIFAAWKQYGGNRYLIIFLAAVAVAVGIVLLLGVQANQARDAVLSGFAWESLINKLFGTQQNPPATPPP